ncbi:hypothetical protein POM88_038622 [Heracleum sosnowskyi]|uniref:Uncharacterized protein n=1 Tax=Heracleum sosnowskyi TaxID=360622 RepID=A0AAD8M725_9APIA|nr:hypothetical protein POM88_038622 [Heracleum sosnowskyi]
MTYDPLKSLHYKVIDFVVTSVSYYVGDLHIYSSETATWKASIRSLIIPPELNCIFTICMSLRREKFMEDSFLVLQIPGNVIRYNLVDRSFKLIWDFGLTLNLKNSYYGNLNGFEFSSTVNLYRDAKNGGMWIGQFFGCVWSLDMF